MINVLSILLKGIKNENDVYKLRSAGMRLAII